MSNWLDKYGNGGWIDMYDDGSWAEDMSLPQPTTPSFYPAGEDRTLTNYQMGTDKARMYGAGSTVWTNQNTPLWAAGNPTPTSTQNFKNTGSLNTSRYRIGDVVPIPESLYAFDPSAGTHDYNQDVQPPKQMVLHAPDTTIMANGGPVRHFLQPNDPKLKQGYITPSNTPSTELATSIGGEGGEPAYLVPSFKYGHPLTNPEDEFYNTGDYLGGPFKTWQEADKWDREVRHPYVEKGQPIPSPLKWWGEGYKHGGHIKKHINSPRVYGNPVNPQGMFQGPSMQRGVMFADGGWINKYEDGSTVGGEDPQGYKKGKRGYYEPIEGATTQFEGAKDYYRGWFNSPIYKQIIQKQSEALYGDNEKKKTKFIDRTINSNINNWKDFTENPYLKENLINTGIFGVSGATDLHNSSSTLDLNFVKNNPTLANSLYAHELAHRQGMEPFATPYDYSHVKELTPAFNPAIHKPGGQFDENGVWHDASNIVSAEDMHFVYTEPDEVRTEIHAIRQLAKQAGVYDPYTESFTKEHLDKIEKLFQEGGPDGKNFNQLGRLRKHFPDESVIDMMNTISQNNNQPTTNTQMARRGGWIDSYGDGSTVGGGENAPYMVDPNTGKPAVFNLPEIKVFADAPWYNDGQEYEYGYGTKADFIDQQKKKYLQNAYSGLAKGLDVSYDNFPKEVKENFSNQYDYDKNSYILRKYGLANNIDLESRGDWVEKLSPGYKNLLANSEYGNMLQPNAWSRSLSGVQQLGNALLPGQPFQFNIPGMTSSELKEANESKLSPLESLSFIPLIGRNIANYGSNRGLSTGSNFKKLPGFFSGQNMSNVDEGTVMAFDPLSYAGLEELPETILNVGKNIYNIPKLVKGVKNKFAELPKPVGPTGVQLSQQEEALLQGTNIGKDIKSLDYPVGGQQQFVEYPVESFNQIAENYKLPEYQSITGMNYEDLMELWKTDKEAFYKITEAHKAKYCVPGSACAKSSNQVTQSIWNKFKTGESFDYNGNAADAWYSKDQITKHGGQIIYDSTIDGKFSNLRAEDLQIGDQVMMGPDGNTGYSKIDPNTGLVKEEGVSHRATIVGVSKEGYPLILESGLGKGLVPVPIHENLFYKGASNYGIRSIVRPRQFIGAEDKIMNTIVKGSQIDAPANIKFTATTEAAKTYKDIFDNLQTDLAHTLNLNQDELIQVFRAVVGIGEQESKLGGLSNAPALTKAKIIVKDLLEKNGLTPYIKDMANTIKKAGKTFFDSAYNTALQPFPGNAKIEMEAYKLVNSGKASNLKEGIELLYNTTYNRPSKFILNTTKASSGVFKQKEISSSGRLFGLRDTKKSISDILNTPVTELLFNNNLKEAQLKGAMANFTDIMSKLKKSNPTWSNQKVYDMSIQSWNSPTKASSSELVDFFYHGIDNPNPQQIGFDYLTKVRRNMDTMFPITDVRKANTSQFRPTFVHKDGGYIQNNNSNTWLDQYN